MAIRNISINGNRNNMSSRINSSHSIEMSNKNASRINTPLGLFNSISIIPLSHFHSTSFEKPIEYEKIPARVKPPYNCKVVAQGDVHGEMEGLKENLVKAAIIDEKGNWAGGNNIFIQTGDVVDRGPKILECWAFLSQLQKEAKKAEGNVMRILGNHELMYLQRLFKYSNAAQNGMIIDEFKAEEMRNTIIEDILNGNVQAACVANGKLFVHGGLRSNIREDVIKEICGQKGISRENITLDDIAQRINELLVSAVKNDDFSHVIFNIGSSRSRTAVGVGGPFWEDFHALIESDNANVTPQVVGHTPPDRSLLQLRGTSLIRGTSSANRICIDAGLCKAYGGNHAFLVINNDGKMKKFEKNEQGWEEIDI